jgi:hypothetical protein
MPGRRRVDCVPIPLCRLGADEIGMDPFVILCLLMILATLWYLEAGGNIAD